ncbi:hypothetical protein GCM10022223_66380 [Kineosporia mesophila]|uniref:Uncharacterized protein n=1 Tax=Kineosporia mesophila TaxID=566012 RepID=A0ABP7ARP8_9ACTN|nr:hypothetical protein [Kineosporia mesophila]MCD5349116.1 hypothetical protein [Kineosporia mesophila]
MTDEPWRQGYPRDRRSESQRQQAASSPFGDFEFVAGRVVARATGARVWIWDDNSQPKMPDLRIQYPHAPELDGYGEVVMAVNADHAALDRKLAGGGSLRRESSLQWGWFLTLSPKIRLDRDWKAIVASLAELERQGFDSPTFLPIDPETGSVELLALLDLGVTEIASAASNQALSGIVELFTPPWGGKVAPDWEGFQSWLANFLTSNTVANKREKLAATGTPQRHLFVGISSAMPWAVLHALDYPSIGLPLFVPQLPDELTHLWLMGLPAPSRCISWWPDRFWFDPQSRWATL